MTSPTDIRRLLARIRNSTDIAETRLEHATQALALQHHPILQAQDLTRGGTRTGGVSNPTANAALTNLGDTDTYSNTRYRPGPATLLSDIATELAAALLNLNQAHDLISKCGIPPIHTRQYQCTGINQTGCTDWADTNRTDHLCIDCGRAVDSNKRRLRRHRADTTRR